MIQLTYDEWLKKIEAQGQDPANVAYVCPRCGTVQTLGQILEAHPEKELKDVVGAFAFSCVGRYRPDIGCDWTLGGLLQIHEVEVLHEDGEKTPAMRLVNMLKEGTNGEG